jgi:hypothetical protein
MAGIIKSVKTTLTVTNGAYTIADVVGGLITLPYAVRENGGAAYVRSIKLGGVVAIAYNLWFLNANIATPAADNAAFTIVAADENKYLGHVPIAAADYVAAQSAFNVATVRNVNLMVQAAAATKSIYAYLVATAVTSPGTTTLYLTVDFEPL